MLALKLTAATAHRLRLSGSSKPYALTALGIGIGIEIGGGKKRIKSCKISPIPGVEDLSLPWPLHVYC